MKKAGVPLLMLFCLLVHLRGFHAWFRADDFAWMGLALSVHNGHDLWKALFLPMAQGTIRPLSERAFFLAGYDFFGLHALPVRIVIFATQFANLWLVASIGSRLTGLRSAGLCAAFLWICNTSMVYPLGWIAVYNQVLSGFFLLLAFYFLLRWVEAGEARYNYFQWAAFLLGFSAMELNVVYPALAAAYTLLCAPQYFRRTLPLWVPAILYSVVHVVVAKGDGNPDYIMHFTGAMLRMLVKYWVWSVGPSYFSAAGATKWLILAAVVGISIGLVVFAISRRAGLFALAWFVIAIAPVLPLRDHFMEYYSFVPVIGLCWLGGWLVIEALGSGWPSRALALAGVALYLLIALPRTISASAWNDRITERVENLVESLARVHELHPGKTVLLEGVDAELFWNGVLDHPHRLIGIEQLYLTPGSDRNIPAQADLGDVAEFVLPAAAARRALDSSEAVVYDVRGPRLRNITREYASRPRDSELPRRFDGGSSLSAPMLVDGWYPADGNHRWMAKRATVRMAGPETPRQKLYLTGTCPDDQFQQGPLSVTVKIDGAAQPALLIRPGENAFRLAFDLPATVVGKREIEVAVEVGRTFRAGADQRDLGLAFGVFEIK